MVHLARWMEGQVNRQAAKIRSWKLAAVFAVVYLIFAGQVISDGWPMVARLFVSAVFLFAAAIWALVALSVRRDRT